jgi:hypothetical protein
MAVEITLLSGVKAKINDLTGKEQEILSKQDNRSFNDKLNDVLASTVEYVGSLYKPKAEFFNTMLSGDRKKLLVELRMYSMDNDPMFAFDYKYTDAKGNTATLPLEVPVTKEITHIVDGEEVTEEVAGCNEKPYSFQVDEYSEVDQHRKVELTLPKSGKKVRYNLLDGKGEAIGANTPKLERSSHTQLKMRNVLELIPDETKEGGGVWTQCVLNNLPLRDIETIRSSIKENEGRVDTEHRFKQPVTDEDVIIDILGTVAFFYPSEAI